MRLRFLLFFPTLCLAQPDSTQLRELACGNCHVGLPENTEIFGMAPSFRYAGVRYNPAYLFDYLKNPVRVRKHIGAARMPDFRFSEEERLALTLFLMTQNDLVPAVSFPDELQRWDSTSAPSSVRRLMTAELKCTACHTLEGSGGSTAVELSLSGLRNNADWLVRYLALPQAFVPHSAMPAQMYTFDTNRRELTELLPHAAASIQAMTSLMMELSASQRRQLQVQFDRARINFPTVTARHGELIFRFQNCGACHESFIQRMEQNAPDLSVEARRVKKDWLKSYLAGPRAVRPSGFHPGTGSRMPDYRLSQNETTLIVNFLFQKSPPENTPPLKPLSPFAQAKAEQLLREKLPCLGCHQFDGTGGRIGPDISSLRPRLQPTFVLRMLEDPQHVIPGSVMPKIPLQRSDLEMLASFLGGRQRKQEPDAYLPLLSMVNPAEPDTGRVAGLYTHFCASCHGIRGEGNGFNARFLPVRPTNHADPQAMSQRADDTLFDGIFAGGSVLNKSHLMPPFGQTLTRNEIRALVRYIRQLCACEGPGWSNHEGNPQK